MDLEEFSDSLKKDVPPEGLAPLLEAMWWDAKGDWNHAHSIAQDVSTADGSWVHAYLHRKEGDAANAGYWYRQAGKPHSRRTLEEEWREIVGALL